MAAKLQDRSEDVSGKRDHKERLISQNCVILLRCHPYIMSAPGEGGVKPILSDFVDSLL